MTLPLDKLTWQPETWTEVIILYNNRTHRNESQVTNAIQFYAVFTLIAAGFVCNALALTVFITSATLRGYTTSYYVIALTVADIGCLFGELMVTIVKPDRYGEFYVHNLTLNRSLLYCHVTYVIRYSTMFLSAWLTAVITVDRFLAIRYPLQVAHISTKTVAKLVICGLVVVALALNVFPTWTTVITHNGFNMECDVKYIGPDGESHYFKWFLWSFTVMSLIVPSIVIFLFTLVVIYFLNKINVERVNTFTVTTVVSQRKILDKQMTVMLMTVSVASLTLRTPYVVVYLIYQFSATSINNETNAYYYKSIVSILFIFYIFNYVLNFFIYCLYGSAFREQLKILILRIRSLALRKHRVGVSLMETTLP